MARLLICVYPRMVTLYEELRCAADVAAAINAGDYLPPGVTPGGLVATCLGDWVYVERPLRPAASPATAGCHGEAAPAESSTAEPLVLDPLPPGQREQQVLQGLAEGLTVGQIAFQLGLAQRTVRFYVQALKDRLGVRSTAQLVGRAISLGFIGGQ
jgi:DNA-binding NarL/FixJ family response regulator